MSKVVKDTEFRIHIKIPVTKYFDEPKHLYFYSDACMGRNQGLISLDQLRQQLKEYSLEHCLTPAQYSCLVTATSQGFGCSLEDALGNSFVCIAKVFDNYPPIEECNVDWNTGFKDMEGTPLFENDIVVNERTARDFNLEEYGRVFYSKEHFCWKIHFFAGRQHLVSQGDFGVDLFDFKYKTPLRVISTAYEGNPA